MGMPNDTFPAPCSLPKLKEFFLGFPNAFLQNTNHLKNKRTILFSTKEVIKVASVNRLSRPKTVSMYGKMCPCLE